MNGVPDAQSAVTPETVTPSSDMFPATWTLKFPVVSADPEIVSPVPLGPAVEETAMPTTELVYVNVNVVCADHPAGKGNPRSPGPEKVP